MLLTLSTSMPNATELGFLLHKHRDRAQSFDVAGGTAHVLWPEATADGAPSRCCSRSTRSPWSGAGTGGAVTASRSPSTRTTDAYRRYVWPTSQLQGVQLAPFQLLASEGRTWAEHDQGWHLDLADRLVPADSDLLRSTRRIRVDTGDRASVRAGVQWWEGLTAAGGEGMVVEPFANLVPAGRGYAQPGIKVRGRQYLRIIYGPDYTEPQHLERLRARALGHKRSLAAREYALGLESLERAVRREPLWRVHEAVFAVLALESEPVDPRL